MYSTVLWNCSIHVLLHPRCYTFNPRWYTYCGVFLNVLPCDLAFILLFVNILLVPLVTGGMVLWHLWLFVSVWLNISEVVVCFHNGKHLVEEGTHIWTYVKWYCKYINMYIQGISACTYGAREDIMPGHLHGGFYHKTLCVFKLCIWVRKLPTGYIPYSLATFHNQLITLRGSTCPPQGKIWLNIQCWKKDLDI